MRHRLTHEIRRQLTGEGIAWELDGNRGTHKWLTIVRRGAKRYEFFEHDGKVFLTCEYDVLLDEDSAVRLLKHEMEKDCGESDGESELRELCGSLYEFASELVRAAELRGSRDATRHRARLNAIGDVLAGMGAM